MREIGIKSKNEQFVIQHYDAATNKQNVVCIVNTYFKSEAVFKWIIEAFVENSKHGEYDYEAPDIVVWEDGSRTWVDTAPIVTDKNQFVEIYSL